MTWDEAHERADILWANVANVVRAGYDPERWTVHVRTSDGRNRQLHAMDVNGHATCHPECIEREARLGIVAEA